MGAALQSFADSWSLARRTPTAIAVLVMLATGIWVGSYLTSFIPFLGFFIGIGIFAFGIGSMYAITDHAAETATTSGQAAIDTLREQWIPLLVAYGIIMICAFLLGLIAVLPLFVVILAIGVTGDLTIGGIGFFLVIIWSFLLYFVFAMVMQFLLPAVIIGRTGGVEAVVHAYRIIRSQPLSVVGFTIGRITIEYGPFVAGIIGAVTVGWEAITAFLDEFQAFVENTDADPTAGPDPVEILFTTIDPGTVLLMAVLVIVGGTIGEVLRILYTASYYRRVEPIEAE